jgi:uncharacterized OB-fold protein
MGDWKSEVKNIIYDGQIKVPYKWNVGETGSRFLIGLRDKQEIWGVRCPRCKKVYVPPIKTCGVCFVNTDEWVKVANTGTVESFTVVNYAHSMQPAKPPLIYGLIKLDGAGGSFVHLIGGTDPGKVTMGMKVKAVFADKREGTILDIKHFAPV